MIRIVITISLLSLAVIASAQEDEAGLIPAPVLERWGLAEVVEYDCRQNYRCEVHCKAGDGQQELQRQNVHRMELAMQEDLLLVAAVYTDAVGKPHQSLAILPRPASCILDNFAVEAVTPLVEGDLLKPPDDGEVIFDMQPDR